MKRRLFKIAWSIATSFATFAEALSHAWKVIKLQFRLCIGVVRFAYMKKDGTLRKATGTLDNIPATKGNHREQHSLLTYFDTDANDWRSARIENLLFGEGAI